MKRSLDECDEIAICQFRLRGYSCRLKVVGSDDDTEVEQLGKSCVIHFEGIIYIHLSVVRKGIKFVVPIIAHEIAHVVQRLDESLYKCIRMSGAILANEYVATLTKECVSEALIIYDNILSDTRVIT